MTLDGWTRDTSACSTPTDEDGTYSESGDDSDTGDTPRGDDFGEHERVTVEEALLTNGTVFVCQECGLSCRTRMDMQDLPCDPDRWD